MNIYPIQTNFTTGILSPRFWARSDVTEYRAGVKDSNNMITTRHGPIESRNGTAFLSDLGGIYARPFGFQLIPNSVTGEAFNAVVGSDGIIKLFGATGTLYTEELKNPDFSLSLENWGKVFTSGLSFVDWSSGAAILTPEGLKDGEIAGISQQVTVDAGTENDDREISFNSTFLGGSLPPTITISIGTSEGGNDLLSQDFLTGNGGVTFNPGGLTSYWIQFTCQNTAILIPPSEGEPVESYGYIKNAVSVIFTNICRRC